MANNKFYHCKSCRPHSGAADHQVEKSEATLTSCHELARDFSCHPKPQTSDQEQQADAWWYPNKACTQTRTTITNLQTSFIQSILCY